MNVTCASHGIRRVYAKIARRRPRKRQTIWRGLSRSAIGQGNSSVLLISSAAMQVRIVIENKETPARTRANAISPPQVRNRYLPSSIFDLSRARFVQERG